MLDIDVSNPLADHNDLKKFNKMKKEEIKILNKFNIKNPYI